MEDMDVKRRREVVEINKEKTQKKGQDKEKKWTYSQEELKMVLNVDSTVEWERRRRRSLNVSTEARGNSKVCCSGLTSIANRKLVRLY
jgi:hypothetical protein